MDRIAQEDFILVHEWMHHLHNLAIDKKVERTLASTKPFSSEWVNVAEALMHKAIYKPTLH